MATDVITNILPDIYEAMDVVSREKVGMAQGVTVAASSERASLNQNITVDIEPAITGVDATPAMTTPEPAALTPTVETITISNSKAFPFQISGDVAKGYETGVGLANGRANRIAQALRAAVNDVESTLAGLHSKFSRAYGIAGTTPFASSLADTAQLVKILDDNGAPAVDRHLVIDTTAGANMRTLTQLTKANEAASDDPLRRGVLLDVHGFAVRESAQVNTPAAGTGSSYLVNDAAGYSVGDTAIAVDTGTGTILAGDVITFAGDANKYVVKTALSGGSLEIAAPGLRVALADNTAVTVVAKAARNMAFSRNAIVLAARPVATPVEGDMAEDRQVIVDPVSGLPFEFAFYKGYKMNRYEVNLAWGASVVKPEHTALLLG
jgi:hypothetical protein